MNAKDWSDVILRAENLWIPRVIEVMALGEYYASNYTAVRAVDQLMREFRVTVAMKQHYRTPTPVWIKEYFEMQQYLTSRQEDINNWYNSAPSSIPRWTKTRKLLDEVILQSIENDRNFIIGLKVYLLACE